MKVPFHLRRQESTGPTTGLLVSGRDTTQVVEAIVQLGLPLPEVYAIPEGFLIRWREPIENHPPGLLRLRELAPHLFLPVDAELIPGLLDDEAAALVREQGLIFLPGDTVLAYDRVGPLRLAELAVTAPVRRDAWNELPPGSRLIDRIRVILDERPPPTVEAILQVAENDLGSEAPPRPPEATSTTAALTGNVQSGFGRFFLWMGGWLNWRWLAQQGANLLGRAMQNNPRTAEDILGRQEAALRELLREFREGDRDEALRRALPLGGGSQRGATVSGSTELPTHNLRFSLGDLLRGDQGRGPASVWITPEMVAAQLAEEYRRAARDAAATGDYPRAAFIYGKLLGDFRLAADMLARAGLHQEAAILYLDRVGDERAAAASFAAAGDINRALQLYRRLSAHIEAGDLLRRVGDEEAALEEYRLAAERLLAQGRPQEAGDLYRDHVERADQALPCYQRGWSRRPAPGATHCALALLDLAVHTRDKATLLALAEEIAEFYSREGAESEAVQVFNHLVRLGEQTLPAEQREQLRDLALVGLAKRLRQHATVDRHPGSTVSTLFGQQGVWAASLVADAEVALRGELRRQARTPPRRSRDEVRIVPLEHRGVTAVAGSVGGEALFLGFEDGHILRFHPATGNAQVIERSRYNTPVDALACDALGLRLLALAGTTLEAFGPVGSGRLALLTSRHCPANAERICRLSPILSVEGVGLALLWGPETIEVIDTQGILTGHTWTWPGGGTTGAVPLAAARSLVVRFSYRRVQGFELLSGPVEPVTLEPGVELPPPSRRVSPLLAKAYSDEDGTQTLAFVAHDDNGNLWLLHLDWQGDRLHSRGCWFAQGTGYLAECLLERDQIAAVRRDGVVWIRRDSQHLEAWSHSPAPLEDAVAVWPGWMGREVIVVRARGDLVRIQRPR